MKRFHYKPDTPRKIEIGAQFTCISKYQMWQRWAVLSAMYKRIFARFPKRVVLPEGIRINTCFM
jgi:hypothetical protein